MKDFAIRIASCAFLFLVAFGIMFSSEAIPNGAAWAAGFCLVSPLNVCIFFAIRGFLHGEGIFF